LSNEISAKHDEMNFNLVGIDVKEGINRFGGNEQLYKKLLTKFYRTHSNDINVIRQHIDKGDIATAERLTHTIKGIAGTLGAHDISSAAGAIEVELRTSRNDDNRAVLIAQLEKAFEQAFPSIALLEETDVKIQSSEDEVTDISTLIPMLEKLATLIDTHDMDSRKCLEDIIDKTRNTDFFGKVQEMIEYVEQYDFNSAARILNEMRDMIKEINNDGER
jgi:HPt (histidine-containing phosphotransfer) domain-containing protein